MNEDKMATLHERFLESLLFDAYQKFALIKDIMVKIITDFC